MNRLPPVPFPIGPVPVDTYLDLLPLVGIVALIMLIGILAWGTLTWNREAVHLFCPARRRWVRAVFRLDADGRRTDVLRCSVFGRRPITCGKPCLGTAAAR